MGIVEIILAIAAICAVRRCADAFDGMAEAHLEGAGEIADAIRECECGGAGDGD